MGHVGGHSYTYHHAIALLWPFQWCIVINFTPCLSYGGAKIKDMVGKSVKSYEIKSNKSLLRPSGRTLHPVEGCDNGKIF